MSDIKMRGATVNIVCPKCDETMDLEMCNSEGSYRVECYSCGSSYSSHVQIDIDCLVKEES